MTVRQLLTSLDSEELSEWMALQRVEREEQKQSQLRAKAELAEQKLRGKRKWRP